MQTRNMQRQSPCPGLTSPEKGSLTRRCTSLLQLHVARLCTANGFCQQSNNMHLGATFTTPNISMAGMQLQPQDPSITARSKRKRDHMRKQHSCPRFRGTAQGHCTGFSSPGAIGASCMWSLMCHRSGLWDTYGAALIVHMQLQTCAR